MHTGIAPARFLAELRIQRAKDLLQTCSSVKQVAECVGFSDNLYFSKAFKKQTGVSPSEFRQHLKKE
ncbi:AraC family transcriptional regulator [Desulfitobacterium hafniense]|uniref:AraC family transcriptional regulator n=1 Tax=Desulfitobacterium hafniense TaxID=49338 RepID=A0A0W1JJ19_DESHA|nr:helix-turn-helix transcriptional regulator [Desulfitobacterium hafniense]KTE91477.1 AraC family transcriptional regulator [Desulfitobacterium hafniense]